MKKHCLKRLVLLLLKEVSLKWHGWLIDEVNNELVPAVVAGEDTAYL
jgi:hypothetical protein